MRLGLPLLLVTLLNASPVLAQQRASDPIVGFWPDVSLTGGGGIGLGHALEDRFMGRLRLGALLAREPFIAHLGVSGQVGGLGELGLGAELEVNHFRGPWLLVGASRVQGDDWMTSVVLGLIVFGVEWQHRFVSPRDNALLFTIRLPIGIWWLMHAHQQAHQKRVTSAARR